MKRILLILTIFFGAFQMASAQDHINWTTNVKEAKAMAAKQDLPIFAFFTGKDWCPPCKKLTKNTLETSDFASYAKDNFIMLELDFPRGQRENINPENMRLLQKFSVQGFPTVILMDADENKLGQTGYRPFTPEEYIEHITSILKS